MLLKSNFQTCQPLQCNKSWISHTKPNLTEMSETRGWTSIFQKTRLIKLLAYFNVFLTTTKETFTTFVYKITICTSGPCCPFSYFFTYFICRHQNGYMIFETVLIRPLCLYDLYEASMEFYFHIHKVQCWERHF